MTHKVMAFIPPASHATSDRHELRDLWLPFIPANGDTIRFATVLPQSDDGEDCSLRVTTRTIDSDGEVLITLACLGGLGQETDKDLALIRRCVDGPSHREAVI